MADFTWPVAVSGYEWRAFFDGASNALGLEPVQRWPVRHYAPLEEVTGLFLTLAATNPTPDEVLAFANRFGHLGGLAGVGLGAFGSSLASVTDTFEDWRQGIERLKR